MKVENCYSDQDMLDFYEWCDTSAEANQFWKRNPVSIDMSGSHHQILKEKRRELLELWKLNRKMKYLKNRMTGSFFRIDSLTPNVLHGVMISPTVGSVERRTLANSESTLYEWEEVTHDEWIKAAREFHKQTTNLLGLSVFEIGDRVHKIIGDYTFDGEIIGIIHKRNGTVRVVAELDGRGLVHIFNENQLQLKQQLDEFIEGLA